MRRRKVSEQSGAAKVVVESDPRRRSVVALHSDENDAGGGVEDVWRITGWTVPMISSRGA